MKRVAILGCGPAGLLAAHAAHLTRVEAHVFSQPVKSVISGAQFLHVPIPDLTTPNAEGVIKIVKFGDERGYALKVYGSEYAPTSFNKFIGTQGCWSLRKAYDTLWDLYGAEHVFERVLDPTGVAHLLREYDLVLSSIPAKTLCFRNHTFLSQPVVFVHGSTQTMHNYMSPWEHYIVYSGRSEDDWYRMSNIFGNGQMEFPADKAPHRPDYRGIKPIGTDCDCLSMARRIGRFGQWKKGVLTHHAFQEALDALQQL